MSITILANSLTSPRHTKKIVFPIHMNINACKKKNSILESAWSDFAGGIEMQ